MKKQIHLLAWVLLFALLFAGCTPKEAETVTGTAKVDYQGEVLLEKSISVPKEKTNASEAFLAAFQEEKFPYTLNDGMFDSLGGYDSTMQDGWILYHDGNLTDVGAEDTLLEDGFLVEFRYVNYTEVFGDFGEPVPES